MTTTGPTTHDAPGALVPVRLLALPLDLHEQSQAHTDGLLREFRLLDRTEVGTDVPDRLLRLVHDLEQQYSSVSDEQEQVLQDAVDRGELVLPELVFAVPGDIAPACTALMAMLDEADAYCTSGQHLLMLATPRPLVAYRTWYLLEFVHQLAGDAPVPWPQSVWAQHG